MIALCCGNRCAAPLQCVSSCSPPSQTRCATTGRHPRRDQSPHSISFVTVAPEVTLEVLDWAGSGPPLVLLAGLGNSAHVFDGFAQRLADRFHVIGITRRGYGASSQPTTGYDVVTLAHDILAVLDAQHIDGAVLVGHSIAGDEMTTFAATYQKRAHALVYLDAAYDRTKRPTITPPAEHPTEDDKASVARYNEYFARTRGWRWPEGFQGASIEQFRREVHRSRAVVLDSGEHYLFLTNEAEVVGMIRDFLSGAKTERYEVGGNTRQSQSPFHQSPDQKSFRALMCAFRAGRTGTSAGVSF